MLLFCFRPPPSCFLNICLPTLLAAVLNLFFSTNNISYHWHRNLQQISSHAFCSWNNILCQERYGSFLNNLCKSSETTALLASNTTTVWKFRSVWSNHLTRYLCYKKDVGEFSKHAKNLRCSYWDKGNHVTRRFSHIKVYEFFQQSCELRMLKSDCSFVVR